MLLDQEQIVFFGGKPVARVSNCAVSPGTTSGVDSRSEMWYLLESDSVASNGSNAITVNLDGGGSNKWVGGAVSYSNVNQSTTFNGDCVTNTGDSNAPQSAAITSNTTELAIDVPAATSSATGHFMTPNSPTTGRQALAAGAVGLGVRGQIWGQSGASPTVTNSWSY